MNNDEKNSLIELYKIAREESFHWDTVNMHIYSAMGVIASLLLVAISFLFAKDFPLSRSFIPFAKVGILLFFLAFLLFSGQAINRTQNAYKVSGEVIGKIVKKLGEDKELLIAPKLGGWQAKNKWEKFYSNGKLWLYIVFGLLVWIGLGLFLFLGIDP